LLFRIKSYQLAVITVLYLTGTLLLKQQRQNEFEQNGMKCFNCTSEIYIDKFYRPDFIMTIETDYRDVNAQYRYSPSPNTIVMFQRNPAVT
jgi:hypothetical protein